MADRWPDPTKYVDGALIHGFVQLKEVHRQQTKRGQGNLVVGVVSAQQLLVVSYHHPIWGRD